MTSKWRCRVHLWGCDLSSVSRAANAGESGRKARGLDEMGEVSVGRGRQQSGLSPGTFLGGGRRDEAEPANELSRNSRQAGGSPGECGHREPGQHQVLQEVRVEKRPRYEPLRTLGAALWRERQPDWRGWRRARQELEKPSADNLCELRGVGLTGF